MTASRLQGYALFLASLNYTILHRSTKEHSNCDALSHLAIPSNDTSEKQDRASVVELRQLDSIPLSSEDIRRQTRKDPVLSLVYNSVQSGHWSDKSHAFEPFYTRRNELSTQSGVVLWGSHIVILIALRRRSLMNCMKDMMELSK